MKENFKIIGCDLGTEKDITVYVIWGPLLEKVIAVHKTEEGVNNKLEYLNKDRREDGTNMAYYYTADKFLLEE